MAARKKAPERPLADEDASCSEDAFCVCRDIVRRAHSGMMHRGFDEGSAVEVAIRVFRYHHPDASFAESRELVEHWVLGRHLH